METHPSHLGLTLRPAPETHETHSSEAGPMREGSRWSEKTAPGVGKSADKADLRLEGRHH